MVRLRRFSWQAERLLRGKSCKGHFDSPDPVSHAGRHLFDGWVAADRRIEDVVLEIDGCLYRSLELYSRPDVPSAPETPYVTGWRQSIEMPECRESRWNARIVVDGTTAATTSFIFDAPAPKTYAVTPDESSKLPSERFFAAAASLPPRSRVLEIGTKQAVEGTSTHDLRKFPGVARADYVMCDVLPGVDVDVVGDLHDLPASWAGSFDAFVATAVFEHLERPWIAAKEIARVLKPGGLCFVATHQCFPLHGYPSDFFRFSKEALRLLFEDAGLEVLEVAYDARATITTPVDMVPPSFHDQWNATWPSYIGVALFAMKPL